MVPSVLAKCSVIEGKKVVFVPHYANYGKDKKCDDDDGSYVLLPNETKRNERRQTLCSNLFIVKHVFSDGMSCRTGTGSVELSLIQENRIKI